MLGVGPVDLLVAAALPAPAIGRGLVVTSIPIEEMAASISAIFRRRSSARWARDCCDSELMARWVIDCSTSTFADSPLSNRDGWLSAALR